MAAPARGKIVTPCPRAARSSSSAAERSTRRQAVNPGGNSAGLICVPTPEQKPVDGPQTLGSQRRQPGHGLEEPRGHCTRVPSRSGVLEAVSTQPGMEILISAEPHDGAGERLGGVGDERGGAMNELHSLRTHGGGHHRQTHPHCLHDLALQPCSEAQRGDRDAVRSQVWLDMRDPSSHRGLRRRECHHFPGRRIADDGHGHVRERSPHQRQHLPAKEEHRVGIGRVSKTADEEKRTRDWPHKTCHCRREHNSNELERLQFAGPVECKEI
jgi:hypothetical protein